MYIHILVYTILSAHSFVGYMSILVSIMLNTDFENVQGEKPQHFRLQCYTHLLGYKPY